MGLRVFYLTCEACLFTIAVKMKSQQMLVVLLQFCLYLNYAISDKKDTDICVLLKDCPYMRSLSQQEIKNRICGYENNRYAKVWCTVNCITPDFEKGVCIPSQNCVPFNLTFRHSDPSDEETREYLRKFVCVSISTLRQHYVCCPNNPLPAKYTTPPPVTSLSFGVGGNKQSVRRDFQCGVTAEQYKIVGGSVANIGEHPWAALLQYTNGRTESVNCGGTLVSRRFVITAAHCVSERFGKLTNVILGEHNTSSPVDCVKNSCAPRPQIIRIQQTIIHDGWRNAQRPFYDDIALLKLEREVVFSEFVQPICLAPPNYIPTRRTKLVVVGWGQADDGRSSEVKRTATLYLQDSSACLNSISIPLKAKQICVGGGTADSCNGDSGGPLTMYIKNDGVQVWYLVGIVSLGYNSPCGTVNRPGIYTSVSHYLSWIHDNIF